MKIALISFTAIGARICLRIKTGLTALGYECRTWAKGSFAAEAETEPYNGSLNDWTADAFSQQDALVFVGACGIAVRAIAPFIKSKSVDPAVVVVDEMGKYSISLLSGHLGGANEIASEIAKIIGAISVITTATDLNKKFAVDDWAKKNHLRIGNMQLAKEISAAILNGVTVGVSSDYPIEGQVPDQLQLIDTSCFDSQNAKEKENAATAEEKIGIGFRVSIYETEGPFEKTLHLFPQTVSVGIGCRKGIALEAVEELFYRVLKEHRISVHTIEKLCSIDIKKEEAALNQLADKLGVPLQVFSAEELKQVDGEFSSSEFVNQITGVDNVCERTAVLGSRGELIVKKQALNGVTVALAVRKEEYRWMQQ